MFARVFHDLSESESCDYDQRSELITAVQYLGQCAKLSASVDSHEIQSSVSSPAAACHRSTEACFVLFILREFRRIYAVAAS